MSKNTICKRFGMNMDAASARCAETASSRARIAAFMDTMFVVSILFAICTVASIFAVDFRLYGMLLVSVFFLVVIDLVILGEMQPIPRKQACSF